MKDGVPTRCPQAVHPCACIGIYVFVSVPTYLCTRVSISPCLCVSKYLSVCKYLRIVVCLDIFYTLPYLTPSYPYPHLYPFLSFVSMWGGGVGSGRVSSVAIKSDASSYPLSLSLSLLVMQSKAAIWERLLSCSLQPLKQCLGTVRREFARLCCTMMEEYLSPSLVDELEAVAEEVGHSGRNCSAQPA